MCEIAHLVARLNAELRVESGLVQHALDLNMANYGNIHLPTLQYFSWSDIVLTFILELHLEDLATQPLIQTTRFPPSQARGTKATTLCRLNSVLLFQMLDGYRIRPPVQD